MADQTSIRLVGHVYDTTDASSATSGSLIVDGGVGIAKKLYIGDNFFATKAAFTLTGGSTSFTISPGAGNVDLTLAPSGTGRVVLNADPTSTLHAATKGYVDGKNIFMSSFATTGLPYTSIALTTTFTSIGYFIFPGSTTAGTPTSASIMLELNGGTRTGTVRIFDITNSLTICSASAGTAPVALSIVSLGALSNIPTAQAIFAIQVNRSAAGAGTTNFRLSSVIMSS